MAKEGKTASDSQADFDERVTGTGVAIETWARISLARTALLAERTATDAASADVYLKYAEAVENAVRGQQA
jgi:hypothetical protein